MATLYAETKQLRLHTGAEVEAFVRVEPSHGTRPKCLLLHGNPGSLLHWEQLIPRLTSAADVAAVDLPGFGRSARTSPEQEALNLDRLAEHTVAAIDALGWREPITVIGHSHGGGVAQVVAARFPDRVSRLVLVGTLGAPAHASYRLLALPGASVVVRTFGRLLRIQRFRSLNRLILRRVLADLFSPDPVPPATLERELDSFAARPEILVSMVHVALGRPCAQLLRSAPEIRCPTLFIHGSNDAVVPQKYAKTLHDRLGESGGASQFRILRGAGHLLIDQRAPELADMILEALRTVQVHGSELARDQ
ncbi:MAG TPA: alpha/beta hydrolase [Polyangiaceae bacterium]|nr:alpha/beta hydrolase [Polyangiaceae bacterium]